MVSLLNPKKKKKNKAIVMWSNNRNTEIFFLLYIFDGTRKIVINLQKMVEMNDNVDAPYELRR